MGRGEAGGPAPRLSGGGRRRPSGRVPAGAAAPCPHASSAGVLELLVQRSEPVLLGNWASAGGAWVEGEQEAELLASSCKSSRLAERV